MSGLESDNKIISPDEVTNDELKHTNNIILNNEINDHDDDLNKSGDNSKLSKRAKKRLLKHEKWLEYRPIKRAKERERMKRKKEEARLTDIKLGPSRKQLKNMKMSSSDCKLRVVLDFSYDHLMNDKDLNKCINQMSRCYSINRRSDKPLQLHVTSFCGKSKEIMQKHNGYNNWDVNFWSENYIDVFDKENLIYLTSDSDNTIDRLDESNVYIIGALVDHNYHKGISLKTATDQGIQHGKLPIREFLDMKTRQVLTIDHVFAILVNVASYELSWKEAFLKVIPQRKGAVVKQE